MNTLTSLLLPLLLSLLITASSCFGKLIGAAVIPHGDFALDPSLVQNQNGSKEIHDAAVKVGQNIMALRPDIIFMSSPHGISSTRDFLLYQNTNGSGFALIGQDLHNASYPDYKVPMNIALAPNETSGLLAFLQNKAQAANVSGLLSFADSEAASIRWGEVVPLYFLRDMLNGTHADHRVMILTVPTRRYTEDVAMIPEMLAVGALIGEYLESLDESVVWVVSSDLAHTHLASGPYGFSPSAEPFDEACGTWATTGSPDALLVQAASYVDQALSCGFTGLVLLQGMLQGVGEWSSQLYANFHPTYYGMMVAQFFRQ